MNYRGHEAGRASWTRSRWVDRELAWLEVYATPGRVSVAAISVIMWSVVGVTEADPWCWFMVAIMVIVALVIGYGGEAASRSPESCAGILANTALVSLALALAGLLR